jgi:hypothetical protein
MVEKFERGALPCLYDLGAAPILSASLAHDRGSEKGRHSQNHEGGVVGVDFADFVGSSSLRVRTN